jgi:hypothetical protein
MPYRNLGHELGIYKYFPYLGKREYERYNSN